MQRVTSLRSAIVAICTLATIAALAAAVHADQVVKQLGANAAWGPIEKGLMLSVTPSEQSVQRGQPIEVTFAIKNTGSPVSIFRYGSLREFSLSGSGPDGSPIQKYSRTSPFNGSYRSGWQLGTGEAYEHTSDLGKMYDFRAPGKYTFSFKTVVTQVFGGPAYATLTSNTVEVIVQ
jgi:hypothetical protein